MAFDHDAKLFDVLANGYHLNTQLHALLGGRPLDSLGQQEAMAFSQELSRVFEVSMSMLSSNTVTRVKTAAPVTRTGNSSGVVNIQAARDKRARSDSGEVVTPVKKKSREDGVTRKEITASPHKDGYEWRKYGQKNIQNCNFVRYYFRCSRDRRCEAKKKVQQQDGSRGQQQLPPMFEVTYVNEHTCHALRAIASYGDADASRMAASPRTTNRPYHGLGVVDTARDGGGSAVLFDGLPSSFRRIGGGGGGSARENETIVSCLADVIRGAAPSPSPWPAEAEAGASYPAAAWYVPPAPMQASAGHSASVGVAEDGGAMMMIDDTDTDTDTDFCWDPSSFCAVGEGDQLMMDHRDAHVDVARLAETVWPRHTSAGACPWR